MQSLRGAKARRIALAILLVLAAFAAIHVSRGESGEVAVLETRDAEGTTHRTRLWVAEHEGARWLLAGQEEAAWLVRARRDPAFLPPRTGRANP